MTDFHVHIGQYEKAYYYADRVFSVLKKNGVDEVYFSSTTSCIFCKESTNIQFSEHERKNAPSASTLYEAIRYEVKNALVCAKEIGIKTHALYWVVPDFHFANCALTIKKAMDDVPYDGFKIHPFAQKWNLKDERTAGLAEEIFDYTEKNKKRIVIHTGVDDFCSPKLFEKYTASHKDVLVQLAHCRPLRQTVYMLDHYENVFCDSSMTNRETIAETENNGLKNRVLYGSDFPITHWREYKPDYDPTEKELSDFFILCITSPGYPAIRQVNRD